MAHATGTSLRTDPNEHLSIEEVEARLVRHDELELVVDQRSSSIVVGAGRHVDEDVASGRRHALFGIDVGEQ